MTLLDALGYFAASLVLATFCAKSMVTLRVLAIASNLAFIAYGFDAQLWPILLLHSVMLPLNLHRLRETLGASSSHCGRTMRDRAAAIPMPLGFSPVPLRLRSGPQR